jgi:hypothetical protein
VHRAAELIGIDGYRGGWLVDSADAALLALRFTVVENLEPVIARVERGGAPARAPALSRAALCTPAGRAAR